MGEALSPFRVALGVFLAVFLGGSLTILGVSLSGEFPRRLWPWLRLCLWKKHLWSMQKKTNSSFAIACSRCGAWMRKGRAT